MRWSHGKETTIGSMLNNNWLNALSMYVLSLCDITKGQFLHLQILAHIFKEVNGGVFSLGERYLWVKCEVNDKPHR